MYGRRITWRAAGALLAGCAATALAVTSVSASSGDAGQEARWPARTPQTGIAAGMSLPLERYLIAYADDVAFSKATYKLDKACMTGFGLALPDTRPGSAPPPAATSANMPRRYGITDAALARAHGYHLAEDDTATADGTDDETPLTERQLQVLHGGSRSSGTAAPASIGGKPVPAGGCASESVRRLGGGLDEDLASELTGESFDTSRADARVRTVLAAWSACMGGKGYQVTDPLVAARVTSATATPEEIRRAVDDVTCKQPTGLVKTWFAVETEIQNKLLAQHRDALEATKAKNAVVLRTITGKDAAATGGEAR
ncbi:hypothetical protein ABZ442_24845 [Streptomyces triculaminicus]|uniref:hypothetical protein n=1 Tax=Streptomyces triculaminicus TaxID=2816232 RepID=UPI0033D495CA